MSLGTVTCPAMPVETTWVRPLGIIMKVAPPVRHPRLDVARQMGPMKRPDDRPAEGCVQTPHERGGFEHRDEELAPGIGVIGRRQG